MRWIRQAGRTGGAILLLFGFAVAAPRAAVAAAGAKPPSLDAASQALDAALQKDDVEGLFAHMTDDVVLMPPGEAPVVGKAAARAWYTGLLSQYRTTSLSFTERELLEDGKLGVVLGKHEWVLQPTAGGEPVTDRGSYIQVWKRQADGRWLFVREIWNASAPPPAQ
jgi:ketosteroid isomerase-like protein